MNTRKSLDAKLIQIAESVDGDTHSPNLHWAGLLGVLGEAAQVTAEECANFIEEHVPNPLDPHEPPCLRTLAADLRRHFGL